MESQTQLLAFQLSLCAKSDEPDSATFLLLSTELCGVSWAQLVILSHRLYSREQCCVHIVEEQLSSVAESRRLVDLVDSSLSPRRAVTRDIKIKTHSPALSQWSRLIRVFVFGTVSLCKALLRYGPLCDTDLQSCVIV